MKSQETSSPRIKKSN